MSQSTQERMSYTIEAEVVPGLETVAAREIETVLRKTAAIHPQADQQPGAVRFRYWGDLERLSQLRVSQAVSIVEWFDIPRPKALLGNSEFRVVMNTTQRILNLSSATQYQTFHISAAGNDSSVMRRFAATFSLRTNLSEARDSGDLWLRLKRGKNKTGWELLFRIGNRPLATRDWRVCNFEGALNATVAHAMTLLSQPNHNDHVINLASGSASLMIERSLWGQAKEIIGVDHDQYTVRCALQNMAAARISHPIIQADLQYLPLAANSTDVILADLPFGRLSGSHAENVVLYPAVLTEAARIAKQASRFVVITHEIKLMKSTLASSRSWQLFNDIPITLRGLHPHIYVLQLNK